MSRKVLSLVIVLIVVVVFVLSLIQYFYWQKPLTFLETQRAVIKPEDFLKAENDIRSSFAQAIIGMVQAVGGAVLLIGLYFTFRNIRATERNLSITQKATAKTITIAQKNMAIAQEAQITERFTRAIEHFGNEDNLAIRLGGIYALERIAKDSKKDHWSVIEVLVSFIKEAVSKKSMEDNLDYSPPDDEPDYDDNNDDPYTIPNAPTIDIQAALTVIGRRGQTYNNGETERINLSRTRLSRASLNGANLNGVLLEESELEALDANSAQLQDAKLNSSDLMWASLNDSNLKRAELKAANLRYIQFRNTNLERADLAGSDLTQAALERANLTANRGGRSRENTYILAPKGLSSSRASFYQPLHLL